MSSRPKLQTSEERGPALKRHLNAPAKATVPEAMDGAESNIRKVKLELCPRLIEITAGGFLGIGEVSLGGYRVNFTTNSTQRQSTPRAKAGIGLARMIEGFTSIIAPTPIGSNPRKVKRKRAAIYAALFFIGTKSVTNHAVNLPTPLALVGDRPERIHHDEYTKRRPSFAEKCAKN
jgi:hypothetical protein